MYSITLQNGNIIDGLSVSGNYFAAEKEFDTSIFTGNLNGVKISCTDTDEVGITGTHEHMRLAHQFMLDGKFLFLLRDIPQAEIDKAQNRADIEYLAMMTGVEL